MHYLIRVLQRWPILKLLLLLCFSRRATAFHANLGANRMSACLIQRSGVT